MGRVGRGSLRRIQKPVKYLRWRVFAKIVKEF